MHLSNYKRYYFIDQFNPRHLKKLNKNITLIWRSKYKEKNIETIHKLAKFCKLNRLSLILENNVKLAIKLRLDGAYISASNKDLSFNSYKFKKNFKILGSAHNISELNIKKVQRINGIFISPVFMVINFFFFVHIYFSLELGIYFFLELVFFDIFRVSRVYV